MVSHDDQWLMKCFYPFLYSRQFVIRTVQKCRSVCIFVLSTQTLKLIRIFSTETNLYTNKKSH